MAQNLKLQVALQGLNKLSKPFKDAGRSAIGLGRDLEGARSALKALKTQQRDVTSFQTLRGETSKTATALRGAKQQLAANARATQAHRETQQGLAAEVNVHRRAVNNLQKALISAKEPNAELNRQYLIARDRLQGLEAKYRKSQSVMRAYKLDATTTASQIKSLSKRYDDQKANLRKLDEGLKTAGVSTRNLGKHESDLQSKIATANQSIEKQELRLKRLTQQQERLNKARERYDAMQSRAGSMATSGAAGLAAGGAALYGGARLLAPHVAAQQQGSILAAQSGQGSNRAGQYTGLIQALKADGVASDVAEIGSAMGAVNSTLRALGDVSDAELSRITRKALDLSAVMGGDVANTVQVAGIMMRNGLAANSDEAFDLITTGMQKMSASMRGELPEILHEYSTHFRSLGFTGSEAMSLLVSMADQGKFALDKTGDAIKEFSIRGSDLSKASTEAYELIGLSANEMSSNIASGGLKARQALQQTAKGLLAIEDPAERANAAIALFGTPVEDLAVDQIPAFLKAMAGAENRLGKVDGAADALGSTLRDNLSGDLQKLNGSWSALTDSLTNTQNGPLRGLVQQLTGIIGGVKQWAMANPRLANGLLVTAAGVAALVAAGGALTLALASVLGPMAMLRYGMTLFALKGGGLLSTLFSLGKVALPLVGKGLWALGATTLTLASKAAIALTTALYTLAKVALPLVAKGIMLIGRALLMTPIGLAVTAIAGGAYLIYQNWDRIGPYFKGLWAGIKQTFSGGLSGIAAMIVNFSPAGLFYRAFAGAMSYLGVDLPAKFTDFGGMMIQGLINGIKNAGSAVGAAVSNVADSSINYFKEKLGIHSPSRVFAELGGFTMAGLEQGLNKGEAGPLGAMGNIAKHLASAGAIALGSSIALDSSPAMAASRSAPMVVQGDTISITIQAMPGADAAAFKQMINQVLDERERQKAARIRSALHDTE